jgi:hypothetical protein
VNPAEISGIELCVVPERSQFAHRLLAVAIGISALSSLLLGRSWWLRFSEPFSWLALPMVAIVLGVLWRIWRALEGIPVPRRIEFLANGRVLVTPAAASTSIECIPGALVKAGGLLAFTFCPCKSIKIIADIQWLSGVDAIGDEKWRQLCVWLVWHRRAKKPL